MNSRVKSDASLSWALKQSNSSFWAAYIDQPAEVTPNGSDCKGILPKMAETFRLRI